MHSYRSSTRSSQQPVRRHVAPAGHGKELKRRPTHVAALRERLGNAELARVLRALHQSSLAPAIAPEAPATAQEAPEKGDEVAGEPIGREATSNAPGDPVAPQGGDRASRVMRTARPPASDLASSHEPAPPGADRGRRIPAHGVTPVIQQQGNSAVIQRMAPCPATLSGPTPAGWQSYHGDPSVFHCGFRGILEDRRPTSDDPQNECFYDHSGRLVDEHHPFSGCRGTPNQYDSDANPILHALIDSGGITRAGGGAFLESRGHDVASFLGSLEFEIRKLYGVP